MRKLSECKNFFKDLFFNCLDENGFDKSPFDCTERAQYETFINTLKFVYGAEFENIRPTWTQEAFDSSRCFLFPSPQGKVEKVKK